MRHRSTISLAIVGAGVCETRRWNKCPWNTRRLFCKRATKIISVWGVFGNYAQTNEIRSIVRLLNVLKVSTTYRTEYGAEQAGTRRKRTAADRDLPSTVSSTSIVCLSEIWRQAWRKPTQAFISRQVMRWMETTNSVSNARCNRMADTGLLKTSWNKTLSCAFHLRNI